MASHTGVDGLVKISTNTIAEVTGFSIEESANTIDDTVLTDTSTSVVAGRTSWSGSIDCFWDESDTTGQELMLIGASITLIFHPEGATAGDVTLTGTAIITGRSKAIAGDSMITQSFSLTGTGALTYGTVSA